MFAVYSGRFSHNYLCISIEMASYKFKESKKIKLPRIYPTCRNKKYNSFRLNCFIYKQRKNVKHFFLDCTNINIFSRNPNRAKTMGGVGWAVSQW